MYIDDEDEDSLEGNYIDCPKCHRTYDEIDYDFQICSKCGWDAELKRSNKTNIRNPQEEDYMNGDANILTGEWN